MLKNIQNNLLLRHPLLWNTKFVPVFALMIGIHILFFAFGFADGSINFQEIDSWRYDDTPFTVGFFSVFIAILILIMWLVFYFRNNAFKSFYPKANSSLYKEWLIIFVLCIANCSYFASYDIGRNLRARSYFAEEEFSRRADIISMASLFADGPLKEIDFYYQFDSKGNSIRMKRDSLEYNHRKYAIKSLLNKDIVDFSYQNRAKDSLNELRVKGWLAANRKDSILWLMTEFDKIAKSHNLKGNITPQKWTELVYNYPEYTGHITVGKIDQYIENLTDDNVYYEDGSIDYTEVAPAEEKTISDTISNTYKVINGQEHTFPKYYVPLKKLTESYNLLSEAWSNPLIDPDAVLFFMYFGLSLSMAVFSFRVTSGRNWLITLVSLGVAGILVGIISITGSGNFFIYIWILIIIGLIIYYLVTCKDTSKGLSAIALNGILWLAPWFVALVCSAIREIIYDKYSHIYSTEKNYTPFESWILNNTSTIMYANLLLVMVYMYFLSRSIKKWKGVAEA